MYVDGREGGGLYGYVYSIYHHIKTKKKDGNLELTKSEKKIILDDSPTSYSQTTYHKNTYFSI